MVRAPCCEKMGLKKGPWTPEEDEILISYIQQNGHSNWRALPKQAGLLRCGKSCRLRWINYLRPDIKRGNFSKEEEETIMKLHEMLGNRWSAIAAKLPGRTDNEIKNVWHTHLKKKLLRNNYQKGQSVALPVFDSNSSRESKSVHSNFPTQPGIEISVSSPRDSPSDHSSVTDLSVLPNNVMAQTLGTSETLPPIDENFRSGEISTENFINYQSDLPSIGDGLQFPFLFSPTRISTTSTETTSKDFWFNLFIASGGLPAEF